MSIKGMRLTSRAFAAAVAASFRQRAAVPAATTAGAFVRGILARHASRRDAGAPLDRILRRARAGTAFLMPAQTALSVALRIDIRPRQIVRLREAPRPFLAWRDAAAAPAAGRAAVEPSPGFVERLFARELRVESTATVRSLVERVAAERGRRPASLPPSPPSIRQAPAVTMIVRHAPPASRTEAPAAPATPRQSRGEAWSARPERAETRTVAPLPLSQSELRDLSDRVVDIIDRRFVAHRERHGRI